VEYLVLTKTLVKSPTIDHVKLVSMMIIQRK